VPRPGIAGVIASVLAILPSGAFADRAADAARAAGLFDEGRALLVDHDDAAGACAKFEQAIALDPSGAGIMLNLGLCNEKLGKYKSALYWFRRAQVKAAEGSASGNEKAAREHMVALASEVAHVRIALDRDASRASVKLDGDQIRTEDFEHVEVDPGGHQLEVIAPGMRPVRQSFDVVGKGGQTIAVHLVAERASVVIDEGRTRRLIAIATAGGGGALWLASGGLSWYERDQSGRYAAAARANDPIAITKANQAQRVAEIWGTGLFTAGAVALATAGYLYLTAPQKRVVEQAAFLPVVTSGGVGIAATGTF
jgi:hypothetical protein